MFTIQTKSCKTCAFYLETAFITIIIIIIIFIIIIIIIIPINIIIKLIIITIIVFFHILEKMSPEKAISFFLLSSFLHYLFCFGQKNGTYSSHTIYVWIILCIHLWNNIHLVKNIEPTYQIQTIVGNLFKFYETTTLIT